MAYVVAGIVTSSYDTYCLNVGLITQSEWNKSPHDGTYDQYATKQGKLTYAQFVQVMPVTINKNGTVSYSKPLPTVILNNYNPAILPNTGGNTMAVTTSTGADWYNANFTAKNIVASNMTSDGNGGLTISYPNGTVQKTGAGSEQRAQEIIAAWKSSTGQAGASNPSDPISVSANNLVKQTIATANNVVTPLNTATGQSWPWYYWLAIFVLAFFALRWLWRKMKRRRRR
jgi:hypothetical protein